MKTVSGLIKQYNDSHGFYLNIGFGTSSPQLLFLDGRQKDIREEILVYSEIHDAVFELIHKLGLKF